MTEKPCLSAAHGSAGASPSPNEIPTIINPPAADTETDEFAFPQELSEPPSPAPSSVTKRAKKPSKSTKARGRSGLSKTIGLCLGGLAAVVLCGVIIIKITKKDGSVTEVTVPDDTQKVEITDDSPTNSASRAASAPGQSEPSDKVRGLTPPGSPKKNGGWHGWPVDAPPPAIAPFDAEQAQHHQEAWAKYLGVPVEYTNSLGMKFRLIPPGEFSMGSTPQEVEEAIGRLEPT